MKKRYIIIIFCFAFLFLSQEIKSQFAIDPAFGKNGTININFGESTSDEPYDILIQPDGKILAGGISSMGFDHFIALTRYHSNGERDDDFGDTGIVKIHFVLRDQANAITLQQDGKIVAVGSQNTSNAGSTIIPSIYRFNSDGSLDTTFADSGSLALRFDPVSSGQFYSVGVLPDGRIVASGSSTGNINGGTAGFGAMRFLENGDLDSTFGANGKARLNFNFGFSPVKSILNSNGSLTMSSVFFNFNTSQSEFVLAKMNSAGSADTTFGENGIAATGLISSKANSDLVVTSEGKILLAGTTNDSLNQGLFTVFRFNNDGTIDSTFGINGRTDIKFNTNDEFYDISLDSDERILLVGRTNAGFGMAGLARLNEDGTPDTTFAPEGKMVSNLNNNTGTHYLTKAITTEDGNIFAAGYNFASNSGDFILAKYSVSLTDINESAEIPSQYKLYQNYPNPFNPSTTIEYFLPSESNVKITLFNMLGEKIKELVNSRMSAGAHTVNFIADNLASGIYFYKIETRSVSGEGNFAAVKKMMLLK